MKLVVGVHTRKRKLVIATAGILVGGIARKAAISVFPYAEAKQFYDMIRHDVTEGRAT